MAEGKTKQWKLLVNASNLVAKTNSEVDETVEFYLR